MRNKAYVKQNRTSKTKSAAASNLCRRWLVFALCAVLIFTMCLLLPRPTEAETVTDTLTIKIGYWGMDEKDYVTKAEYHWTELQTNLEILEVPYSYFKDRDNGSYKTVVAPGRGFTLENLLYYAGVNVSDVKNISFYTNDYANGAFVSFTPYQLLQEPRYYYDNLAAHINNEYNDVGVLTGYSVDPSAEDAKEQVPTMLALESSWNEYEAGTANTFPSFSGLSTSSRFRLLFGQTEPTEMRTNQSAKYVHTVALTIPGTPEVKSGSGDYSGKIMLSTEIGRHTVSFHVAADEAMLDSIMDKLVWTSSDSSVLRIDDVKMGKSAEYDDAVAVQIDYEVLKKGNASINGNYMGMDLSGSAIATDENAPKDETPAKEVQKQEQKEKEKPTKKAATKTAEDKAKSNSAGNGNASQGNGNNTSNTNRKLSLTDKGGKVTAKVDPVASEAPDSGMVMMDLDSIFETDQSTAEIQPRDDSKKYAPFIGVGVGTMLLLGGAASALQFKSELGQMSFRPRRRKI